jgi:cyclopropane fatty-acyl-phospholipid synthase-like methyltransferase
MMAFSYRHALTVLHRHFSHFPLGKRVYVLGRFVSCPFLPVLEAIPTGARVLDIGAGHGAFSCLAAEHGASLVLALEPDLRKSLPSLRHPAVRFVAGFDQAVKGTFDVVTVIDVLYKLPISEWDPLFARVRERLVPGGSLLLKELDPGHRWKALWNRAQEHAANLVNLTLGRSFSYENQRQLTERLERLGFVEIRVADIGRGYPHAHILYVARRPAA